MTEPHQDGQSGVGSGARHGSLDSRDDVLPEVQMGSVTPLPAVSLRLHRPTERPEDAVVVMNKEAGSLPPGRRFADLRFDPRQRRVRGGVPADDSPRADLDDDEDVGRSCLINRE